VTNPELNLELFTRETLDLPKMLLGGTVDLILHDEQIDRENVVNELIAHEHLIHVVPKTNAKNLPFLDHDINDKITFAYLRSQGIKTDIRRLFVDDIHSILGGVRAGLGQAVISNHLFDPSFMRKVPARKKITSPVYLCYLKRSYMPQLIQRAIEELSNNLKKHLV
jgi:DNA-binding transcriptional LysR family regulator